MPLPWLFALHIPELRVSVPDLAECGPHNPLTQCPEHLQHPWVLLSSPEGLSSLL